MNKPKFLHYLSIIASLLLISYLTIHHFSSKSQFPNSLQTPNNQPPNDDQDSSCKNLHTQNHDQNEKCHYVKFHRACKSSGYIPYIQLFFCNFTPFLGYASLSIWLIILFYLLGDTSSSYFCYSLEGLSTSMKLSPTISGVTLLSLGNGAPDIFSCVISFAGEGRTDVGLNGILGAAFFVSSFVVGVISILVSQRRVNISYSNFIGNVVSLLFCLSFVVVVIITGKITLWGALSFLSLYFIYVCFIFMSEDKSVITGSPTLPLLSPSVVDERQDEGRIGNLIKILDVLRLPLDLPRRLTIPNVSGEKWSKIFAVVSAALTPILFSLIWNIHGPRFGLLVYGLVGLIFGLLAWATTERSGPPRKWVSPWLVGGFLMSITWTYVLAQELVSLLVSLGLIIGLDPAILGLTVLAWGDSLGDLVANVALARKGGPSGAQTAISGCYAGPIFYTVVGLGLSFTFSAWASFPSSYVLPSDQRVFKTIGFLIVSLLWALIVLPKRKMRPDGLFGSGLLVIYFCFLLTKMARALGRVYM